MNNKFFKKFNFYILNSEMTLSFSIGSLLALWAGSYFYENNSIFLFAWMIATGICFSVQFFSDTVNELEIRSTGGLVFYSVVFFFISGLLAVICSYVALMMSINSYIDMNAFYQFFFIVLMGITLLNSYKYKKSTSIDKTIFSNCKTFIIKPFTEIKGL